MATFPQGSVLQNYFINNKLQNIIENSGPILSRYVQLFSISALRLSVITRITITPPQVLPANTRRRPRDPKNLQLEFSEEAPPFLQPSKRWVLDFCSPFCAHVRHSIPMSKSSPGECWTLWKSGKANETSMHRDTTIHLELILSLFESFSIVNL